MKEAIDRVKRGAAPKVRDGNLLDPVKLAQVELSVCA